MPTGTPFKSFIPPFPIRVDDFASSDDIDQPALLHLLSHTHSDHITGLSAKSFASTVICSHDAKEMLLRHEVYAERSLKEMEIRAESVRTFQHLKVRPRTTQDGTMYYTGARDLLKPLPLNTPTRWELSNDNWITITLFDANHCPGAVMFLVEGPQGAILHTGDFRAEPWFLEALSKNPLIQRYLAPPNSSEDIPTSEEDSVSARLDAIYLDTACLLSTHEVPSKDLATSGLIELMAFLPSDTLFFINSWTWGYEDVLKAVARAFNAKIHVDRYKHSIYTHLQSEPFLRSIVTDLPNSTRFHACERFNRCEEVEVEGREAYTKKTGRHVVYVNPATMGKERWREYVDETRDTLKRGGRVDHLLVALSRHSPLPELRNFVSMFKPKRIVPNTLDPALGGLDFACLDAMFAGCLHPSSTRHSAIPSRPPVIVNSLSSADLQSEGDVTLKNLEGGSGALSLAERWADGSGRMRKKLDVMRSFLRGDERETVEPLLHGQSAGQGKEREDVEMGEEESQVEDVWKSHSRPNSALGSGRHSVHVRSTVHVKPARGRDPEPLASTSTILTASSLIPSKPPRGGIEGKASLAETSAALARLKAASTSRSLRSRSSFNVPSVYLQKESDEDTDDSDAEEARARTMHLLFAPLVGIDPGPIREMSSSPIPELPASEDVFQEEQTPMWKGKQVERRRVNGGPKERSTEREVEMERPVTPISNRPEHDLPPEPITPLSQSRTSHHGRRRPKDKDVRPIPKTRVLQELGSPIQLHAPSNDPEPSGLEKQRLGQLIPIANASTRGAASPAARAPLEVPFIDLQNVSKSQLSPAKRQADSVMSSPKRRKIVKESHTSAAAPLQSSSSKVTKSVPQPSASTSARTLVPCSPQARTSTSYIHNASTSIASPVNGTPFSTDERTTAERAQRRRRSLRDDRQEIARRLSLAIPSERVTALYAARLEREVSRYGSRGVSVAPALGLNVCVKTSARCQESDGKMMDAGKSVKLELVPSDLFVQCEADKQMDMERSRLLAEAYREEMRKGKRPGLVVPRMACLDSQPESQDGTMQ